MPVSSRTDRASGSLLSGQRGFTLLELLVIIAIMAAVAFVAGGSYSGVSRQANDQLVRSEMQELATAIRRFRQDTGYYPKTGPFGLVGVGAGKITDAAIEAQFPHAGSSPAERARWFYSPANLYQLTGQTSLLPAGHQLEEWNKETGRGWRGPYLRGDDGYVDIRDGINSGTAAGTSAGNPLAGNDIQDVNGVADPFELRTVTVSGVSFLGWSAAAGGTEREVWGRPYLMFDLNTAHPWIVSMGPDGVYNTSDDIKLLIE